MGSGGSVEMKIPVNPDVVADKREKRFIKKHSSQPQNILSGGRSKVRAPGVRASQSLYSVDISGSPNSQDLESARRENELKLTKEQDNQALVRKVQKVEDENSRLRAELQALSRLCQKLRVERQTAIETCNDANQRALAVDQDRVKIQRQFKIFRETKESEIQVLLQNKRDLESKLHRLEAHGYATSNDSELQKNFETSESQNVIPNSPTPPNQWWERPASDTTSLFGSFTHIRNTAAPESNASVTELKNFDDNIVHQTSNNDWHISNSNYLENSGMLLDYSDPEFCDSCQLRCFVTGTVDCFDIIDNLVKSEDVQYLKNTCLEEGYFLSVLSMAEPFGNDVPANEIMSYAISISNVVLCFVGCEDGYFTDTSYELLQNGNSNKKLSILSFLSSREPGNSTQCALIRKDIKKSGKYRQFSSFDESLNMFTNELQKILKTELGIDADKSSEAEEEVSCVEDIPIDEILEQEQKEIGIMLDLKPLGFESYYDKLDDFVSSPSPTPPLLISGKPGSGKTTLLKTWLERLQRRNQNFLLFQHYVTMPESTTADPVFLLRRFLHRISRHLPPYLLPPPFVLSTYDPSSLRMYLSQWLDRLSSVNNKQIVMVIDSIDDVQDYSKHFKWLLDPLPVSVRVVVSVGGACPTAWNKWPALRVKPLTPQHIGAIFTELSASKTNLYRQFRDEILAHFQSDLAQPLHVLLLLKVFCGDFIADRKSLMRNSLQTQSCIELYKEILNFIEDQSKEMESHNSLVLIFQFIYISRNGLNEDEILNILPDLSCQKWLNIRFLLSYFCIITERAGSLQYCNSTIASIIGEKFVDVKISKSRCHMLVKLFTKVYSPRYPRSAEILPWLFYKLERRSHLQNCLLHPNIFHHLYRTGKGSEIIRYWKLVADEKNDIIEHYQNLMANIRDMSALRKANPLFNTKSDTKLSPLTISHVYESVGRFFRDLNIMEMAVTCLERSMETRENELDPDHHLVADCLHYLGSVYIRWKKYAMAEPLLKHALELVECVVGQEHPRVIQELQSLCFVTRKLERHEEADSLTRKIMSLQERYGMLLLSTSRFLRLRKQEAKLEELALEEGTISVANAMNDLGVYCLAQKKLKSASSFFDKSLALKRKLLGENHAEVAQCLHNLSAVFSEEKQYKKAMEHMKKSLEIRINVFGDHSPIIMTTTKNLAILCKKSKDYEQARQVYHNMLKLSKDIHGSKSVATATAMVNLAVLESQLGRYESALPLYEKAREIFESNLGPTCKEVSDTYRNIAILRYNKKEYNEAAALYKKSMAIREQLKSKHEFHKK